ncbi:hypothetical protein [Thiocystis violascens]|uniref:HTH merR-type domain-containing protein n=1 Tax=Thiocystis violascens (strain ATCC 17096 / DSM 198 / 6111) TaxID=765911 RepID=I3Y954_THIV6|nr:hypothetical protein [Thiocystis violascens]AFL73522.1 hypothetical protein Thivi_1526 [Thiocystis violascens DSM 198]
MQALQLRERAGCAEAERKAWERVGVLVAMRPAAGTGVHAQYDDANLVAALIAMEMKRMGVTASRYAAAFSALHTWLRARSSLDWPRYRVFMAPGRTEFQRSGEPTATALAGFSLDLKPLCARLFGDKRPEPLQRALPLPLGAVR